MRGLVWFKEDLRIHDNTALYHAAEQCSDGLICVYIIDYAFWINHYIASCRIDFILRGLQKLTDDLNQLKIPLILLEVKKTEYIPSELFQLMEKTQSQKLFFNRQYEFNESKRDQAVQTYFQKNNLDCQIYDDQTILPPGSVTTQQGDYFKVFTAFKRAWYREFNKRQIKLYPKPREQKPINIATSEIPTHIAGFETPLKPSQWPAGEKHAQSQLHAFIENQLFKYDQLRDFPAINGTSQLSPYLAAGMISARTCFLSALFANQNELDTGNLGAITWMNELIWRDFYKHILVAVPRVSKHRAYQEETEKLHWHENKTHLLAWQNGNTGIPIVDAGMRQLITIGWMHNRLRMITAMFLAKNLFLDWRLGEKYFMSHLIDGDLAANNGGWQWCASTGTDAAPYFRVFNPITQSEKFDPQGDFIRQYCPELAHLDNHAIHDPYARASSLMGSSPYPKPIVDIKTTRQYAIEAFKMLKS
jgi:deoxyribodipyrimidine photo-lyase